MWTGPVQIIAPALFISTIIACGVSTEILRLRCTPPSLKLRRTGSLRMTREKSMAEDDGQYSFWPHVLVVCRLALFLWVCT